MAARADRKRRLRGLRAALLVLLVLTALLLAAEQNLSRTMLDLAYAQAYALAVETINQAVWEATQGGVDYGELVTAIRDEQGRVTMLHANTTRMNELAAETALIAQRRLGAHDNDYIDIPLGSAIGVKFLAGSGPRIRARIVPVGAVGTEFVTDFESAGINQTRHRILLRLDTTVRLVVPTGSQRVDVVSNVPIAESIIVGAVPDSFVDVTDEQDMLNLIP